MDPSHEDARLIQALRAGDEAAFSTLLNRYHASMLRLATAFVPALAVAEEVVQEAWLGMLEGLDRFEGRSSLKTWIFRILINRAKTRGAQERRTLPASSFKDPESEPGEPVLDPAWFHPDGHWIMHHRPWDEDTPEKLLLSKEARAYLQKAIDALPPNQRNVITLRDVEGLDSTEVCNILGLSETYQRVLLHRARARVRRLLADYLEGTVHGTT